MPLKSYPNSNWRQDAVSLNNLLSGKHKGWWIAFMITSCWNKHLIIYWADKNVDNSVRLRVKRLWWNISIGSCWSVGLTSSERERGAFTSSSFCVRTPVVHIHKRFTYMILYSGITSDLHQTAMPWSALSRQGDTALGCDFSISMCLGTPGSSQSPKTCTSDWLETSNRSPVCLSEYWKAGDGPLTRPGWTGLTDLLPKLAFLPSLTLVPGPVDVQALHLLRHQAAALCNHSNSPSPTLHLLFNMTDHSTKASKNID